MDIDGAADLSTPLKDIKLRKVRDSAPSHYKGVGIFLEDIMEEQSEWCRSNIWVYILKMKQVLVFGLKPIFLYNTILKRDET